MIALRKQRQEIHLHVVTISHGLSELCISQSLKSNLRIKHGLETKHKGRESVQITSLLAFLNQKHLKTQKGFLKKYDDIENSKGTLLNFQLFPVMDLDDCKEEDKAAYLDKSMFKDHWLYPYIIPIYNDPNLESTMKKAGIPVEKKKDYIRLFPTNHGNDLDMETAWDFYQKLRDCPCTNMEIYVKYCIDIAQKMQNEY